ncbi:MAG: carboxylesterase family protein [Microbacterium sp.]
MSAEAAVDAPVVQTTKGSVRGLWRGECATFLGIPYAAPPVGALRFQEPVPHEAWDGVRDATTQGATPLRGDSGGTIIPEPSVPGPSTLNVNVFTPAPASTGPSTSSGQAAATSDAGLPVMFYIHGGAYSSGSIAGPWYDGRSFARDGVVTVVVSYRLGFDGFGWIEDAPSNRGVRDWIAALEWVRDNIRAFGGDPDRVTIAGQSAGGSAALVLLGIPAAADLFHAAWSASPAVAPITQEDAEKLGRAAAANGDVSPTVAGWSTLTEGQVRRAARDLIAPRQTLAGMRDSLTRGLAVGPHADGDLIPDTTLRLLAAGGGSDKPLVIGANDDEFSDIVAPYRTWLQRVPSTVVLRMLGLPTARRRAYLAANAGLGRAELIGRLVSDALIRRQVVRAARARAHAGAGERTWIYRFAWVSPVKRSSFHCLEVPFFWDVLDADGVERAAGGAPSRRLAAALHGAAVQFITTGEVDWAPAEDLGLAHTFDAPPPAERESLGAYAGARPLA